MTEPFSGIGFWATDAPSGASRPAGGQGFAMSSEEMRAMLKKAKTQRDTIATQLRDTQWISKATPPANEPVSNAAVDGPKGINETGAYYLGHLRYQFNYYSELIRRMEQALGITESADGHAADTANKAGGSLE
jgi:hypothetical protein